MHDDKESRRKRIEELRLQIADAESELSLLLAEDEDDGGEESGDDG